MSLLSMLKQLLTEVGEAYLDEKIPAAPKTPAARKPVAKKSAAPAKRKMVKKEAPPVKITPVEGERSPVWGSWQAYGAQPITRPHGAGFVQVPEQIRRMRSLSGYITLDGTRSMESLFYQQGKFMEQYTDDFPDAVHCGRSTPMYYNLKDDELRAYFTWRTRYREGALPASQNAFLLLYAYEILNLIGFADAAAAYDALARLYADYGGQFPAVRKSVLRWMPDFAVYYRQPYRLEDAKEAAAITMLRHSSHTAEELLTAADTLSKYHIRNSSLYQAQPEQVSEIFKAVYQALLTHYAEQKQQSFSAYLLGDKRREQHMMFEGAVFCNRTPQPDGEYRLSPLCVYHCFRGQWAKETFCTAPDTAKIGALLRTFDSILREQLHFRSKLKAGELPAGDADVIRQAIADYFEEQKRKNAPVITLNADELEQIRQAAAHTADMLTLPEDTAARMPEPPAPAPDADDGDDGGELPDLPLSTPAMALLICLVTGESYQPLLDAGHMLSVLTDEINENLYDSFGDTVLEAGEDGAPVIVPDYLDELKGMLET